MSNSLNQTVNRPKAVKIIKRDTSAIQGDETISVIIIVFEESYNGATIKLKFDQESIPLKIYPGQDNDPIIIANVEDVDLERKLMTYEGRNTTTVIEDQESHEMVDFYFTTKKFPSIPSS